MKWLAINAALQKIFKQAKKGLKTQIFISWRLFPPSSYTFLLFEVPYFAHGTKRKPITKKCETKSYIFML